MAPDRRQDRDWYERAFDETEAQRRVTAAGRPPDLPDTAPGSVADLAGLPRRSPWKWTLAGVAAILVAVLVRSGLNSRTPALPTSCTTPGLALSTAHTHDGGTVRWSATGPAHLRVLLAIGVDALRPGSSAGQLSPVPFAGHSVQDTELAASTRAISGGCTVSGVFTVGLPKGVYPVRLFRIDGSGSGVRGTPVADARLTVS